jgi:hypothetical protein
MIILTAVSARQILRYFIYFVRFNFWGILRQILSDSLSVTVIMIIVIYSRTCLQNIIMTSYKIRATAQNITYTKRSKTQDSTKTVDYNSFK